jgi:hypothetical protein
VAEAPTMMIRIRKLVPAEVAQLCACGLRAEQSGHSPSCPHGRAQRKAANTDRHRRWVEKLKTKQP